MLKAWPSVLAPKGLHAREKLLIPAFERCFAENSHHQDSLLVQCLYKHDTDHGLRGRDVAATEIGQMIVSLTNSTAAAFWMIYHVFSDLVLEDYRNEVEQLIHTDGSGICTVDLAKIKSVCPILLSTWQETLRYVHIGISARMVMKDIMFDNEYLLKKGATVMTTASVQHAEVSVWGPTVNTFDHGRFLRKPGEKRTNPVAVRSFSGGAALCPGRHFFSTEVMTFTALLLLRFDLKPIATDDNWLKPRKFVPVTSSTPTNKDKLEVKIISRDEQKWQINYSTSAKGVDMVAEEFAQSQQ